MKRIKATALAAVILSASSLTTHVSAQGTPTEYENALSVQQRFSSANVFFSDINPVWISNSSFWYSTNTPSGRTYTIVNADNGKKSPLLNPSALADKLSNETGNPIKPENLYLKNLSVSAKGEIINFEFDGSKWSYQSKRNKLQKTGSISSSPQNPQKHWMETDDEKNAAPVASPNGKAEAFMRDNNIWLRELPSRKEKQLTADGTPGRYYSAYLQWSPDGKYLATTKIRPAEKRYVYYVESSPKDQLQPKLHKQEYAKPGDELMFKLPVIINTETLEAVSPPASLFEPQYSLHGLKWDADSKHLTFEFNQRGHKLYQILEMDPISGATSPIVNEEAKTYVQYSRNYRHDFADGHRILWLSERDNHGHLYLYDRNATDSDPVQVTKGEWYVRQVIDVDEQNNRLIFTANGIDKGEDPYNIKYYSINLDGSDLTALTPSSGTHSAFLSPDKRYLVDIASSPAQPPVATLRDAKTGKQLQLLEQADISGILKNGWTAPEVFSAPGRDGKTEIWGIIQRPSNFDPAKKYPIIEYIYQGPHDQFVPKNFLPVNYWTQTMAELGFIVVMIDGMSTAYRSREFENVCYKNLRDSGLPDHIAWMKAAAEKYPYMDLDRVGIYGCSAGGQESLNAMLMHPDFYKAAYSACGCHDNRMDKVWWNELWMGYPVDDAYRTNSNVENAHKLQGALMLVVGEMDDNVDPASTMQVANALIKANKDFELVVIPGGRHTMGERYGDRKRFDFFVRNLMGVTPPKWK